MLRTTIISVLIASAVARTPRVRPIVPMSNGRIIGGEPANIEELSYQLSLQYFGNHIFGASIIGEDKVLTAAHCASRFTEHWSVRAGSSDHGSGGQVVEIASVCQHPKYDPRTFDNDVSVLRLASPLVFGKEVRPIPLVGLGQSLSPSALATVAGWGGTSTGAPASPKLLKIEVPRVSQRDCKGSYEPRGYAVTDQMVCFGYPAGGKDACLSDAGGALLADGTQIGIISWGLACLASSGYPVVFTDLSSSSYRWELSKGLAGIKASVGTRLPVAVIEHIDKCF